MGSESAQVVRTYGNCTIFCIPYSQLSSVRAIATHRVFFEWKHWVIYVTVYCLIHRAFEIWCVEKIFQKWADLKEDELSAKFKFIQNGSIWISCSTYSRFIYTDKFKYVSKFMFLDLLVSYLMDLKAGYNPLIDNCEHFKVKFWKWLDSVT